jgi:hypothetical protein
MPHTSGSSTNTAKSKVKQSVRQKAEQKTVKLKVKMPALKPKQEKVEEVTVTPASTPSGDATLKTPSAPKKAKQVKQEVVEETPKSVRSAGAGKAVKRALDLEVEVDAAEKKKKCKAHYQKQLNQWDPEDMRKAMDVWEEQKEMAPSKRQSYRKIADKFHVPRGTFYNRVSGKVSTWKHASGGKFKPRVISEKDEASLANLLRLYARHGLAFTREEVKELAFEFAQENNRKGFNDEAGRAGKTWFANFLTRNEDIGLKKGADISIYRAFSANKKSIDAWFQMLLGVCIHEDISSPENIWNVDETGCQDVPKATPVVGQKGEKAYCYVPADRGETMTFISCVSAVGNVLPPMVIFKGKRVQQKWKENITPNDAIVRATESAFVNKQVFYDWGIHFVTYLFQNGFTKNKNLLLLDGHRSHLYNIGFLQLLKENNIICVALPPHTSHLLQPLDVGVFHSFKAAWNKNLRAWLKENGHRKPQKEEIWNIILPAMKKSHTVGNIQGGFRKTGIYPLNREMITEEMIGPSSAPNLFSDGEEIICLHQN